MYEGNLSEPLLGLTSSVFDDLAANADVIIHCGANRSFWDPYQLLRSTNVDSTRNLISMAAGQRILVDGGSALDAVTEAVRLLEDCPLFNAGKGAVIGAVAGAIGGNLWSKHMEDQRRAMEQATAGTGVDVVRTPDNQLKLNIPSDISFSTGSAIMDARRKAMCSTSSWPLSTR